MTQSPTVVVENLTLEYRAMSKRRLVPNIRRNGLPKALASSIGGDFVFNRNQKVIRSLDNVSFSLSAGDRLGLVGANGAGKSTLLSVLAGIYQPTNGKISVRGRVDALFNITLGFRPEASGRRNIILRGLINGWTNEQIDENMDSIIEFSELGEFIDMPFKSYSQGMAARLAFSIATAVTPDILLLDEWIGAGDTEFQKKAKARMTSLVSGASTMIIASHNHALLKDVCTKVLHLEHGRIKAFGDSKTLL